MQLTRVERWILSNQYKILEHVNPEKAEYYKESQAKPGSRQEHKRA